ncbi:GntR family transcriptional regulator [Aldersonia sp. NBC_00410]|uniref:GntR family transcriptional regulator n=1 Tax=Aldersonia sp. NBC_00410 TaxID=2975954 RepID=UPI002252A883|nr:GntR family transcriptional regulator [Aldersonia sp. NBC_00410]MCX5045548.1 GntR family transcriptional regulator [Aldersonia sp. NBC_00410]
MRPIVIEHYSSVPPHEQLRLAIVAQVRSGDLRPGNKIPTVRSLAEQLGIAPNTVARSYRDLEKLGVVETRGRAGTFIANTGDPTMDEAARAAAGYAETVRKLGIADDVALDLIRAALR